MPFREEVNVEMYGFGMRWIWVRILALTLMWQVTAPPSVSVCFLACRVGIPWSPSESFCEGDVSEALNLAMGSAQLIIAASGGRL